MGTKSLEVEHRSSVGFLSLEEARPETKGRDDPLWPGREGGLFPDGVFPGGLFLLAAHPCVEHGPIFALGKKI